METVDKSLVIQSVPAKVLAYVLTLAIPIVGFVATFLVGWCAWRSVLVLRGNANVANLFFVFGMLVSGAAFIRWVWVPLRPAIKPAAKSE